MAQINMGDRTLIQARIDEELTALVDAAREDSGLPRSQWLADLVASHFKKPLPSQQLQEYRERQLQAKQAERAEQQARRRQLQRARRERRSQGQEALVAIEAA